MPSDPETFRFADEGAIPNNPKLPVLVYRAAFIASSDGAAAVERLFEANGWPPQWRAGIFPFHHYHSTAHEVLGIAHGQVRVRLGGERGRDFDLKAGDVVVLPAGTGHKRLMDRGDLVVVGGYPPGPAWNLLRGEPSERPAAVWNIARVPLPKSGPVRGKDGPLLAHWRPEK
jgi:uncharacterized protein YjlB